MSLSTDIDPLRLRSGAVLSKVQVACTCRGRLAPGC